MTIYLLKKTFGVGGWYVHMHSHPCGVHVSAGMCMTQYSPGSQMKTTSDISSHLLDCLRQGLSFSAAYTKLAGLPTPRNSVSTSHLDIGAL